MSGGRFDPAARLIVVDAVAYGRHRHHELLLALDTGASVTTITPDIVDELGYSPRDGLSTTSVTSAIGDEVGYRLRVKRFEAFGFAFSDFMVHVYELPSSLGIDGLLGLNFLRYFNYEIRSIEGRIVIEEATP